MSGHKITRSLTLDMGHRVPSHNGGCRNLHGHTYKVETTFAANQLVNDGAAEGMIADFGDVKTILMAEIHAPCDHRLTLYGKDPLVATLTRSIVRGHLAMNTWDYAGLVSYDLEGAEGTIIHVVNFVPTAENLARYWFKRVEQRLKLEALAHQQPFSIECIRVHETPNCYADYSEPRFQFGLDERTRKLISDLPRVGSGEIEVGVPVSASSTNGTNADSA